jgi:hypothetical protein
MEVGVRVSELTIYSNRPTVPRDGQALSSLPWLPQHLELGKNELPP